MKKLLLLGIFFTCVCRMSYAQCSKAIVSITGPSPVNICEGTPSKLSGLITLTSPPMTSGYTYSWLKVSGSGTIVLVPPTTLTNIASYPGTIAAPDYTGITGLAADAGTYILRVEDGNAGNSVCYTEASVAVIFNPKPVITGNLDVCNGYTSQLTGSGIPHATTPWTSATSTVATVSVTGVVTGVADGTSVITCRTSAGCIQTAVVTVHSVRITGTLTLCKGSTTQIKASATGTWTSANPAIATIDNTGLVTGIAPGTSVITFSDSYGCSRTATITVSDLPTITGILTICEGFKTQLIGSGIPQATTPWTSLKTSVATVSHTGTVTGIAAGTSTITYMTNMGCIQTAVVTVNTRPTITGTLTVCPGATTQLTGSGNAASWTSMNTAATTVDNTGLVTGIVPGTSIIKYTNDIGCSETATITVLNAALTPSISIIQDKTTICEGNPVTFTSSKTNAFSPVTYEWFINNISQGPASLSNTFTSSSLTPGNVVYAKMIMDAQCGNNATEVLSNNVSITVYPVVTAGTIGSDQTICYEGQPAMITETTAPTGTSASLVYIWELSPTGLPGTFTPVTGATNANYTPGRLTQDTYIRRTVIDPSIPAPCNTAASNVVHITVRPQLTAGVINGDQTICAGAVPAAFTSAGLPAGGTGTYTYQWQSDVAGTFADIAGATNTTYASGALTTTTKFQRVETSGTCGTVVSNLITVSVANSVTPTISVTTSNSHVCEGFPVTFTATATGTGNNPDYQWVVNGVSAGPGTTGPITQNVFTTTYLVNGDQVWAEFTSSLGCLIGSNPFTSNRITMVVKPMPAPVINEGDQTVCAGNNFTFTSTVSAGSTYQWGINGTYIPGATNDTYNATLEGNYVLYENNGICNAISAPVTITIDPCGAFSSSITGPNPITPGQQNVAYRVANQAGFTYEWSITGGTIVSGQNTNAVTVDWDPAPTNATARTAISVYSISVKETNPSKQSKTTTLEINELTTGVTKSLAQAGITLFPNPTVESFSIEMPESGVAVNYEIVDLTGTSVAQGNFISSSDAEKITTGFGAGIYQVILRYNNTVTCGRLSKIQ